MKEHDDTVVPGEEPRIMLEGVALVREVVVEEDGLLQGPALTPWMARSVRTARDLSESILGMNCVERKKRNVDYYN